MTQEYSNPDRETDPYSLPELEIFERTARECALDDEELVWEYYKRFPLSHMNSRDRERMIDTIVEEEEIRGGWFYWYCFPGCLPDSEAIGPFDSYDEALAAGLQHPLEDED